MPLSTDQMISRLASTAAPVRRLKPPLTRSTLWLLGFACAAAVAMPLFANFGLLARRLQDSQFVLELIGTSLTGMAGIVAAFNLSLHDRSRAWALLPIPPLLLWLAS